MERSAVPDGARAHLDGYRDEPVPEAEALGQLQSDAVPWGLSASDAWDGAPPDEAANAARQHPVVPGGVDAERSADPVQGGPARDASFPPERPLARLGLPARPDGAAPCRPDAVQSGERSYAALDSAASAPVVLGPPGAECWERLKALALGKRRRAVPAAEAVRPPRQAEPVALAVELAERLRPEGLELELKLAVRAQLASRSLAARSWAAQAPGSGRRPTTGEPAARASAPRAQSQAWARPGALQVSQAEGLPQLPFSA